jgi:hypothetical protein
MGEQFIDLFTAGAYALVGRMYAALASPGLSWLFYALAAAGILVALIESAVEQRPDFWLRHLAVVGVAAVLTLLPQRIDLGPLTYGAPGRVETYFGTHTGAAPHLTYWIERMGATASVALRALTQRHPSLAVPGVAAQVDALAADPASLNDAQLKANLEIWRRRVVPQVLADRPELEALLREQQLLPTLTNPTPASAPYVGAEAARRAQAVQSLLAQSKVDLSALLAVQAPMLNQIAIDAGATPWIAQADAGASSDVRLSQRHAPAQAASGAGTAYDDALQRGDAVAGELRAQLPQADAAVNVAGIDQLYDLLGRSILYNAGVSIALDPAMRATVGSLCQTTSEANCRSALAPLVEASAKLHVSEADGYNTNSLTTMLRQPVATLLLTITSMLLLALSNLVLSVLPFALGIAKAIAIVISMIGTWLLLWPGRVRIALTWMLCPISFVSLWSVFFNLWSDIEPSLSQLASLVSGAEHGSWSARNAMSIAISLGYMGLPSLALGVVYGESGRALYHASARVETALMTAWHTRGSIAAFGRRWLVNSPLGRRWNQRVYRAMGLGPLHASRAAGTTVRTRSTPRTTPRRSSTGARSAYASPNGRAGEAASSMPGSGEQGELFGSKTPSAKGRRSAASSSLKDDSNPPATARKGKPKT